MYHTYQAALTDQDYAFSIYSALKSGSSDEVKFDSWKNSTKSLSTGSRPNTASAGDVATSSAEVYDLGDSK